MKKTALIPLFLGLVLMVAVQADAAQFIKATDVPGLWFNADHGDDSFDLPSQTSLNDGNAPTVCPRVVEEWLKAHPTETAEWTGIWRTMPDGSSACDVQRVIFDVPAGHLFNNNHAKLRCEEVLREWMEHHPGETAEWTGKWKNIEYEKRGTCRFRRTTHKSR